METLKRFGTFLKESWEEVRHQVTYPSWQEVKGTAKVVIITTVLFSIFLSLIDVVMAKGVTWFFQLFA